MARSSLSLLLLHAVYALGGSILSSGAEPSMKFDGRAGGLELSCFTTPFAPALRLQGSPARSSIKGAAESRVCGYNGLLSLNMGRRRKGKGDQRSRWIQREVSFDPNSPQAEADSEELGGNRFAKIEALARNRLAILAARSRAVRCWVLTSRMVIPGRQASSSCLKRMLLADPADMHNAGESRCLDFHHLPLHTDMGGGWPQELSCAAAMLSARQKRGSSTTGSRRAPACARTWSGTRASTPTATPSRPAAPPPHDGSQHGVQPATSLRAEYANSATPLRAEH
eukprot:3887679-Rhodomonas_salina.2